MAGDAALRVPVGADAERWRTVSGCRTVLAVVHNVTAATRMVDILTVLEGDLRLQVVFAVPGSSPFDHGISEWLAAVGAIVVPWWQAKQLDVDLVICTSHGGELHELKAPIAIFPHGIGYNKYLDEPTSRRADEPTSRRADEPTSRRADEPCSGCRRRG